MIKARNRGIADQIVDVLESGAPPCGCLRELVEAASLLDAEGFDNRPSWQDLANGARPPAVTQTPAADERAHGWQYVASSTRESFERTALLRSMCRYARAHLRSQSGICASLPILTALTSRECILQPERWQVVLRRRLHWPLSLTTARCEGCGQTIDERGDHLSSCMRSGRVKLRATPVERIVAQICRKAGARVRINTLLRDLNLAVRGDDERRLEVVACGLPVMGGSQLAIDVTLRSPLTSEGMPRSQADWLDGATAAQICHSDE